MKTSELISRLQEIDSEVPFDAEVVTGSDWMPDELVGVHHDAPHTYLKFSGVEDSDELGESRLTAKELEDAIRKATDLEQLKYFVEYRIFPE